jgi:hypothetical protein
MQGDCVVLPSFTEQSLSYSSVMLPAFWKDIHLPMLAMFFVLFFFLLLPWLSSLIVVYVATNIRRDNHLKKFKTAASFGILRITGVRSHWYH